MAVACQRDVCAVSKCTNLGNRDAVQKNEKVGNNIIS